MKSQSALELNNKSQVLSGISRNDINAFLRERAGISRPNKKITKKQQQQQKNNQPANQTTTTTTTATTNLGCRRREKKERFKETIPKPTEDRRLANYGMLTGNDEASKTYVEIAKAINKCVRRQKRGYTDDPAHEAQSAAERSDISTKYGKKRPMKYGRDVSSLSYHRKATCRRVAT